MLHKIWRKREMTTKIRNQEQNAQRKQAISAIALILVLAFSALITIVPVNAAERTYPTFCFLTAQPNPTAINQQVNVVFWLSECPPTANGPAGEMWAGFTVTVTAPDGKTETLGPFKSDDVGSAYTLYTPTQVGTYTMQCNYPGQTIQETGDTFQSSVSQKVTLTVQSEPLPAYPTTSIPTGYWTRPINSENRNWASIGGNWLTPTYNGTYTFGGFNAYTTAPNTAHIVWAKPIAFGGIVGGANEIDYYTGQSYEWKFQPIIVNGYLIYNRPLSSSYYDGVECLDLRTGQELWFQNGSSVSCAQIYDYESPNQHGAIPYLWSTSGSTWTLADAFTGEQILSITGAPTSTLFAPSAAKQFMAMTVHFWYISLMEPIIG